MSQSSIDGQAVPLDAAIAEAARLVERSRLTVVAGLGADVAGARAAIALCDRIGGVIDHMHSTALLRDLDVMREYGMMLTTPGEARTRADVVLLVGEGLWKRASSTVAGPARASSGAAGREGAARRILWLCADEADMRALARAAPTESRNSRRYLPTQASLSSMARGFARSRQWQARLAFGRSLGGDRRSRRRAAIGDIRRGCLVGGATGRAAIEMLCGLVRISMQRRVSPGLPLAPGDNAAGVLQVCGWMTGFPMRTGFGRGFPEHDPWTFDAERLVESGEADCAIWISAYRAEAPRGGSRLRSSR